MMPVVRISDATFVDLKSVATWLGTKTPSETIERLVQEQMNVLGLERDFEENVVPAEGAEGEYIFDKIPGLSFTRILSASVDNKSIEKCNWLALLCVVVSLVKARGYTAERLVDELQVPAKAAKHEVDGYKFHPDLNISIQGQSAADAWKEVSRLAQKYHIPVEVRFQWRDNEKAQYPGRVGVIRAGY